MVEEETNPDDIAQEEIFLINGGWKITKMTADAIHRLLEPIQNHGDITYCVEWSPGEPLSLCVKFQSLEDDMYESRGSSPLEVVQDLMSGINS